MIIVTRNIHKTDKSQTEKYAARYDNEKDSMPRTALVVCNAKFPFTGLLTGSGEFPYEVGFGCGQVVAGDLVGGVSSGDLEGMIGIEFNGHRFVTSEGRDPIKSANQVIFTPFGIFASGVK